MKKWILLFSLFILGVYAFAQDTLPIAVQSQKRDLQGIVIAPTNKTQKMPAIIFLVGSGNSSHNTNYRDFLEFFLLNPLEKENVALVFFDKCGAGKSEGKWYKTNFEERATDAKNVAKHLKTLPFIDTKKVYVVGHSQGGWIVQVCLANYPQVFAGGVSMAGPVFSVRKQLVNDYRSVFMCQKQLDSTTALRKARRTVNRVLFFTSLFPVKENWKQLRRIKRFQPQNYLKNIKKPLFLMWASNDRLVSPVWCWEELNQIFPKGLPPYFETHTSIGADHSFKVSPFCYVGKSKALAYADFTRLTLLYWLRREFARE